MNLSENTILIVQLNGVNMDILIQNKIDPIQKHHLIIGLIATVEKLIKESDVNLS